MAALTVESRGQALGGITISSGVAEFSVGAGTIEDLLPAAGAALYAAKAQGRNQVSGSRSSA